MVAQNCKNCDWRELHFPSRYIQYVRKKSYVHIFPYQIWRLYVENNCQRRLPNTEFECYENHIKMHQCVVLIPLPQNSFLNPYNHDTQTSDHCDASQCGQFGGTQLLDEGGLVTPKLSHTSSPRYPTNPSYRMRHLICRTWKKLLSCTITVIFQYCALNHILYYLPGIMFKIYNVYFFLVRVYDLERRVTN